MVNGFLALTLEMGSEPDRLFTIDHSLLTTESNYPTSLLIKCADLYSLPV